MRAILKLSFLLTFLFFSDLNATENNAINLTRVYGFDSNPHHLPDSQKVIQEEYWKASMLIDSNYDDRFFFIANVNRSQFVVDERADTFDASGEIRVDSGFGFDDIDFAFEFAYGFETLDKTYVSQYTGFIGTFAGESIADRYDFDETNYQAKLKYKPYRTLEVALTYTSYYRVYTELEIAGLTNLDNDKIVYQLGLEYLASDKGRFFFNGEYARTAYEERLSRDLQASIIANDLLILEMYDVNIGYIYEPEKGIHWEYKYNYQNHRDKSSGYYNGVQGFISMTGKYAINDFHHIYGTLGYYKFSFKNQDNLILNPLEEDAKERHGTDIKLSYEWIIATLFKSNLAAYADLGYTKYINKNFVYSYQQAYAGIGIRWSAF
ncbi:MAG: hypothetical protein ACJAS9_001024 [Polaribacter sp.]|jgi:hypothetical protein